METTAASTASAGLVQPELIDVAAVRAELDEALSDALRRASTRAEHIRLVRIAGLVSSLTGQPAA